MKMASVLISNSYKADVQLFVNLTKRMGVRVIAIQCEGILDMDLLKAMREGKNANFVSKENITNKLRLQSKKVPETF